MRPDLGIPGLLFTGKVGGIGRDGKREHRREAKIWDGIGEWKETAVMGSETEEGIRRDGNTWEGIGEWKETEVMGSETEEWMRRDGNTWDGIGDSGRKQNGWQVVEGKVPQPP